MITLYVKTGCPYCAKAIATLKEHNVSYEEKNISDPAVVKELLELGGKRQVPFMEDDNMTPYLVDDDVEMYESDDIVSYVNSKYGAGEKNSEPKESNEGSENIRVHNSKAGGTCTT